MKNGSIVEFIRKKDYIFIKEIGQGGTGKTVLIKDEIIDDVFVCKKYSPYFQEHKEEYFKYFLTEIKLLHTLYHKNVVRVFNYYLYPEQKTGYILMEYVKGENIENYLIANPDKLEDIFLQTIEGFMHLEGNNILHRDIRPDNILISDEGLVKIIDFGFGKQIDFESQNKSISLNWRYSNPSEFDEDIYDFRTELFFVGKLFEEIILAIGNVKFKYSKVISKMLSYSYNDRINSFFDVFRETLSVSSFEEEFTWADKSTYQHFANKLLDLYSKMTYEVKYNSDIDDIMKKLEELYKNSQLEEEVQDVSKLASIFINGQYSYYSKKKFAVANLLAMIQLLKSVSQDKRKVILNNLWERFDAVPRYTELPDDLPF